MARGLAGQAIASMEWPALAMPHHSNTIRPPLDQDQAWYDAMERPTGRGSLSRDPNRLIRRAVNRTVYWAKRAGIIVEKKEKEDLNSFRHRIREKLEHMMEHDESDRVRAAATTSLIKSLDAEAELMFKLRELAATTAKVGTELRAYGQPWQTLTDKEKWNAIQDAEEKLKLLKAPLTLEASVVPEATKEEE